MTLFHGFGCVLTRDVAQGQASTENSFGVLALTCELRVCECAAVAWPWDVGGREARMPLGLSGSWCDPIYSNTAHPRPCTLQEAEELLVLQSGDPGQVGLPQQRPAPGILQTAFSPVAKAAT